MQHEFAARPWSKVSAELCELPGRTLLVVCNYYSNFIEVENINKANATGICKALKAMFARYGVPDVLMSDNVHNLHRQSSHHLPRSGALNMSRPHHVIRSQMERLKML